MVDDSNDGEQWWSKIPTTATSGGGSRFHDDDEWWWSPIPMTATSGGGLRVLKETRGEGVREGGGKFV